MKTIKIHIDQNISSNRLDKLIHTFYPDISRRHAKRLIDRGSVFVNGKRIRRASFIIKPPCNISIHLKENKDIEDASHQIHWSDLVIYRDDYLLVVNKPAGIPTAPTLDSAVHNTYYYLQKAQILPHKFYPFHRLDKDTTGVLLIPLRKSLARSLNQQLQNHEIKKRYLALCQGEPSASEWTVEGFIQRSNQPPFRPIFTSKSSSGMSNSSTSFKVILFNKEKHIALIEAIPHTGRYHQIRLHLEFSSLPVIGDKQHGKLPVPSFITQFGFKPRMMLHSYEISFFHQLKQHQVTFQAPLPVDFSIILQKIFQISENIF